MPRTRFLSLLLVLSVFLLPTVTSALSGLLTSTLKKAVGVVGAVVDDTLSTLDGTLENIAEAIQQGTGTALEPSLLELLLVGLTDAEECVVTFEGGNKPAFCNLTAPTVDENLTAAQRTAKIEELLEELDSLRNVVQAIVWALLDLLGLGYKSFKSANIIHIPLCTPVLEKTLMLLPGVASVDRDIKIQLTDTHPGADRTNNSRDIGWGVTKIQAVDVWSANNTGQGVRVATLDSGVRGTHEALRNNFLGNEYEGYGWFDPLGESQEPVDDVGHGTHTAASLAGWNGLGVAPGAQWMSCKFCGPSGCSFSAMMECAEWIMAPTRSDGSKADASLAPHIVSNSWTALRGAAYFDEVLDAWYHARIIAVFATGNNGRNGCSTAMSPGDAERAIAVGATDMDDRLGEFSSLGPSINGRIKPDFTCPGVDVRSAWNGGDSDYLTQSGTSMAAPILAGTIALMKSVRPGMCMDAAKYLLASSAERALPPAAKSCGGAAIAHFPNNENGYGRINARKAVRAAMAYNFKDY